jgi:hypothetical protein
VSTNTWNLKTFGQIECAGGQIERLGDGARREDGAGEASMARMQHQAQIALGRAGGKTGGGSGPLGHQR